MDTAEVYEALRQVIDPEVGVNVVDLGLIYEVADEDGDVLVRMTMTTPACPMGSFLCDEAEAAVRHRTGRATHVSLTFDPPWSAERVTPEGRRQLGWDA